LAELLSESENVDTTRALSADAEVAILPEVQSEVWLNRAEFEDLIRPQAAETVEALRSADVGTADLDAKLLASRSSRVPFITQPVAAEFSRPGAVDADPADPEATITPRPALSGFPADVALPANVNTTGADIRLDTPVPDLSSVTTIPLNLPLADVQLRRAGSRRFKRFAAAGVLALVGAAASVPFMTSDNGPIPPAPAPPWLPSRHPTQAATTLFPAKTPPEHLPRWTNQPTASRRQRRPRYPHLKPPGAATGPRTGPNLLPQARPLLHRALQQSRLRPRCGLE
ncbi:MAG: hypothetical protein ACREL6_11555, partial [Gemmatimonadales bacterium]